MPRGTKPITTDRQVASLSLEAGAKKSRHAVTNRSGGGLCVEVRADRQVKTWIYRFRLGGRQFEMTLGAYPMMPLAEARQAHTEAAKLVVRGIDPRRYQAAEKARNIAAWTMQEAFDHWIDAYTGANTKRGNAPSTRTVAQQQSRWRLHLAPRLGRMYVRDVTRPLLIEVLSGVSARAKEESRKCLGLISMLMEYCEGLEQIAMNPAAGLTPAKIQARPNRPRERHLSLEELQELWGELDKSRIKPEGVAATAVLTATMANAIKFLILTGMRRAEVAAMRWAEVRGHDWYISSGRTKSLKGHRVFVSSLGKRILSEQRQHTQGLASPYVFPSLTSHEKHVNPDSISTAVARLQGRSRKQHDEKAPLFPMEHFTAHDLRRSAATLWTEKLKADPLLVEKMLSHSLPTLIETYNRSERWPAMVNVWERWGELFQDHEPSVAKPSNVVVLRPGWVS